MDTNKPPGTDYYRHKGTLTCFSARAIYQQQQQEESRISSYEPFQKKVRLKLLLRPFASSDISKFFRFK